MQPRVMFSNPNTNDFESISITKFCETQMSETQRYFTLNSVNETRPNEINALSTFTMDKIGMSVSSGYETPRPPVRKCRQNNHQAPYTRFSILLPNVDVTKATTA